MNELSSFHYIQSRSIKHERLSKAEIIFTSCPKNGTRRSSVEFIYEHVHVRNLVVEGTQKVPYHSKITNDL